MHSTLLDGGENVLESTQVVSFTVGAEEYGVHIEQVQEIIRMPEITNLPQTAAYIKGIINLRGNIIPVIDMRNRFNMESIDYSEITRVIVLSIQEKLVGIVVDSVAKVLELANKDIEVTPDIVTGLSQEYIEGVGKVDNRMIIILEADKVLTADEIRLLSTATQKVINKKENEKKSKKESDKEVKENNTEIN